MGIFGGGSSVSTSQPRVSSFQVNQSVYGAPLKLIFGTAMISAVLGDYMDFTSIAHTTTTSSGGKGGGEVTQSNTEYTYTVAPVIVLGEGQLSGVGTIWRDTKATNAASLGLTFFNGTKGQSPWGYMLSKHPDHALTYSGTSYLAGVLDLGGSASMPNMNFEVYGMCQSQGADAPQPTRSKMYQFAYTKEIEIHNYDYGLYITEYVWDSVSATGSWQTIDSKYYEIEHSKDQYGEDKPNDYTITFNFDDRDGDGERVDPTFVRVYYTATTASVDFTAKDANPRDILYTLLTSTVYGAYFPSELISDLYQYATYCEQNSILISPVYDTSTACTDIINELMECTNSEFVFSQGKVKIIPYWDGLEPLYNITDGDIIDQGEDSIDISRTAQADTYNIVPLEHIDRANEYNTNVVYATDEGDIELHGVRQASTYTHHEIMNQSLAQAIAQVILQKQLYNRNTYKIRVGQEFILLEPMDAVTLESQLANLGITSVRVVEIKENADDFTLEITFEDNLSGTTSAPKYETQDTTRAKSELGVEPGNANQPTIFEAPLTLVESATGFELWLYSSGGIYWGGCNVWVSYDQEHYKLLGQISGKARQGTLRNTLPATSDPDETSRPIIDLNKSSGELVSGTLRDANYYSTLCYLDGEFISYETATLIEPYTYELSYLRRGAYNSQISQHPKGSDFVRCDDTVFKYPFTQDDIGRTVYIKLCSFNIYGQQTQELSDVPAYQYTIKGTSLTSPLPQVTGVTTYYRDGNMIMTWNTVKDSRSPIEYEVRRGDSWQTAEILGRTFTTEYQIQGNGRYWVSACYKNVYSVFPTEILVTGARYTANVIATIDEKDTGWQGDKTTGVIINDNNELQLGSVTMFDTCPDVDSVANWDFYGGVCPSGTYTIPADHIIDIGKAALCNITVSYTARGESVNTTFDLVQDVDSLPNWDGDYSPYVSFGVQMRLGDDDGNWSEWQDFYVGEYNARYFEFRINLATLSDDITAIVSDFYFTVDVPDISESRNITIEVDGTAIYYENHYHTVPYPQFTLYNADEGDDVILIEQKQEYCVVKVMNNGESVERSANFLVQSY